jgi:hypothetical protein
MMTKILVLFSGATICNVPGSLNVEDVFVGDFHKLKIQKLPIRIPIISD